MPHALHHLLIQYILQNIAFQFCYCAPKKKLYVLLRSNICWFMNRCYFCMFTVLGRIHLIWSNIFLLYISIWLRILHFITFRLFGFYVPSCEIYSHAGQETDEYVYMSHNYCFKTTWPAGWCLLYGFTYYLAMKGKCFMYYMFSYVHRCCDVPRSPTILVIK